MNINDTTKSILNHFVTNPSISDLHIKEDWYACARENGKLIRINIEGGDTEVSNIMSQKMMEDFILDLFKLRYGEEEEARKEYIRFITEGSEEDFAIQIQSPKDENGLRARVNIYKSLNKLGAVLRCIPSKMPDLGKIGFDPLHYNLLKLLVNKKEGLILVTGQTGSGKSTTLASLVNHINQNLERHIVTIEDPVEFKHLNNKSIITHREVGSKADTKSFHTGLKSALREDPDIIMVGELRDAETTLAAIQAGQTGHIVLSTIHTNSAPETISRILDMFPPEKADGIRTSLGQTLLAILSQKLVPDKDGKRKLVYEILLNTSAVKNSIIKDKDSFDSKIRSLMDGARNEGMITIVYCLAKNVMEGHITEDVAREYLASDEASVMKFNTYIGNKVLI